MSHPWSDSDSEEDDSFFLLEENLVPLAAVTVTVTDGRFFPFLSRAGVVVAIDRACANHCRLPISLSVSANAPELSAIGLAPLGRVVTTCGPATIVGICASSHLWMQLDRDLEKLRRVSISHFSSVKLTAESLGCEGVVTIDDEDPPELLLAPLLTFGLRHFH
jgi:hypothetical protein